jgi:hypothetical protein
MVEYSMKKNTASQSIGAQMITIADGSDFVSAVTVEVTVDGSTKAAGGGTVTHEGEGYHSYAPTQAETNGDHIAFTFSGTGAVSQTVQVYTTFPQSADNDTILQTLPSAAQISTTVWGETTRVLTAGTNLNDVSVSDILTTQMTESYSADGTAPTLAQSLFLIQQNLQDFSFAGTTQTVKKLDGSTTAATYTLDDATAPTSKTRAT